MSFSRFLITITFILLACSAETAYAGSKRVKVFILVGQSNMVGHGKLSNLTEVCNAPNKEAFFKKLKASGGDWIERKDVRIWFNGRSGALTVGYGAGRDAVGPELQFGQVMGDHFSGPVLLIKCAWGGKSIYADFRPPSSGGAVGPYYTSTVKNIKEVLGNIKTYVPGASSYEIAGLAWFQGWNDMISREATAEYEENLANFIKDIRKELNAPNMPVVIGETGNCGNAQFKKNQEAVAKRNEFKGTVGFVKTERFVRPDGPGAGYHWHASAESYCLIGNALAEEMKKIVKESSEEYVPGINEKELTRNTQKIHKLVLSRKYASAIEAMKSLNQKYKEVIETSGETAAIKKEREQFKHYVQYIQESLNDLLAEIHAMDTVGNVYKVDALIRKNSKAFAGIDAYDKKVRPIATSLRSKRTEIAEGRILYGFLTRHNKKPSKRTAGSLKYFAKKNEKNVYGKAALRAIEQLENDPKSKIAIASLFEE